MTGLCTLALLNSGVGPEDESVRRDILFRQMDDAYATIMRQSYFALFEKQAHEMVQQNASVDEISAAYFENLKEQFIINIKKIKKLGISGFVQSYSEMLGSAQRGT